jgi:hypothetical protein
VRIRILTPLLIAALVAGCGADEEPQPSIPADSAAALEAQLNSIQDRFEFPGGQACGDITGGDDPNTAAVSNLIDSLPDSVDADVRDALVESFDRLFELVEQECAEAEQTDTETAPETDTETETTETTTETETTDTTETEPPTTETEPTETEPTETLPPTETVPPTEGDDDGGAGIGAGEG